MADFRFPEVERLAKEVAALRALIEGARIVVSDEWMTVHEACDKLGVTRNTILRKISNGELEARGSGKTRQVRLSRDA